MNMDEQAVVVRLVRMVKVFAERRAACVECGGETPRYAALMVQKYGEGLLDAEAEIFDRRYASGEINKAIEEEMAKIYPLWREHNRERREGGPADVVVHPYNK